MCRPGPLSLVPGLFVGTEGDGAGAAGGGDGGVGGGALGVRTGWLGVGCAGLVIIHKGAPFSESWQF